MGDIERAPRFISGPCGMCCGEARYSDGRWCESCGKTGTVHMMVTDDADPCRGAVEALRAIAEPRFDAERPWLSTIAREALQAMGVPLASELGGR
jgi:hypothetical protein